LVYAFSGLVASKIVMLG